MSFSSAWLFSSSAHGPRARSSVYSPRYVSTTVTLALACIWGSEQPESSVSFTNVFICLPSVSSKYTYMMCIYTDSALGPSLPLLRSLSHLRWVIHLRFFQRSVSISTDSILATQVKKLIICGHGKVLFCFFWIVILHSSETWRWQSWASQTWVPVRRYVYFVIPPLVDN